jgi:pimeloyl-ACP methyl ester carboxylesterase
VKGLLYSIAIMLDNIRRFFVSTLIKLVLIFLIVGIVHNCLKMSEVSTRYNGIYKNLEFIYESKMMNVYQTSDGEKTVVILAKFGTESPIIQYKNLIEDLKVNYKVVVVELFGYGFSMGTDVDRSNEQIASEIKTALEQAGVGGPYVFLTHGLSDIYAMEIQQESPELVSGIISIDPVYPNEMKDDFMKKVWDDYIVNVRITSVVEFSGFARVASYIKEDLFNIDKMKQHPEIFTNSDINIYRQRIGSSYLTSTMVKEINAAPENLEKLEDYKYPDYLPTRQILTSYQVDKYKGYKNAGAKKDSEELSQELISNSSIQLVKKITANSTPEFSNPDELTQEIIYFLTSF